MNGWIDTPMDRQSNDRGTDGWIGRWLMNEWMDGLWMNGLGMDEWMD